MKRPRKHWSLRETGRPLPPRDAIEDFQTRILAWAQEHGRDFPWRHVTDPYRVAITELLLQQTSATAVAKCWHDFFEHFPTPSALASASDDEIASAIGHLGLHQQRTRRIRALARWMAEHGNSLPTIREELEAVPGVGQYVASAVLAVCAGQPEPLLDVNMTRVIERYFGERTLADIRDDPWLQETARAAAPGARLGWAVLDFAASICRARAPRCARCPVAHGCRSFNGRSRNQGVDN